MELPTVTPQEFDEALRPFLDMVERDLGVSIRYTVYNKYPTSDGCNIHLIFDGSKNTMSKVAFDRCVEQGMELVQMWASHFEADHGVIAGKSSAGKNN